MSKSKVLNVARRLRENCEDSAVVYEILKDFNALTNEEKEGVVIFLLGSLKSAHEFMANLEKKLGGTIGK